MHRFPGFGTLFLIFLLLSACRPTEEASQSLPAIPASPTAAKTSLNPAVNTVTFTPQPTVTPLPTVTPSPIPTIEATATPLPAIEFFVPSEWRQRVEKVLANEDIQQNYPVLQLTADEQAPIRLVHEETSLVVKREPLVLTVPFTSGRHEISEIEASAIINTGHDQIEAIPWSKVTMEMRALRVDGRFPTDDDYPFQDIWSLDAAPGYEAVAAELVPYLGAASDTPLVHLVAVGDIMLDRSLGSAIADGYLEYPFTKTAAELRQADITVGNLESALGNVGEPVGKRYPFRAPPEAAAALALAGFDILSLANNHAGDYGNDSLLQAIELLTAQKIAPVGAGANAQEAHAAHVSEINGLEIAFFSYVHVPVEASTGFDTATWTASTDNPGIAWADPEQIALDVATIRDEVDLVVVLLHSGFEYQSPPSEPQVTAAHAAVDAGANLVIGHHAHILQGIEFYRESAILYGTGNFAFEIDGAPETALFNIWLTADGVHQIEIKPAIIQFGGQPRLAETWESPAILNRVYHLTNILNAQ